MTCALQYSARGERSAPPLLRRLVEVLRAHAALRAAVAFAARRGAAAALAGVRRARARSGLRNWPYSGPFSRRDGRRRIASDAAPGASRPRRLRARRCASLPLRRVRGALVHQFLPSLSRAGGGL